MADQAPQKTPESPTTARQLDFDDEEPQENASNKPLQATVEDEETAPSKPPRPASPQVQAENTLIEAFPAIDAKVVKAVLSASGGQVEPAFNALLGMSDPSFNQEEAPPPQPPRPTAAQRQLEQDEMYARQLAQHYHSSERAHRGGLPSEQRAGSQQRGDYDRRTPQDRLYAEDRERNFFDDDLPEIQRTLQKGFQDTQKQVNSWFNTFKKRLEGDDDDPYNGPTRLDSPPGGRRPQQHSDYYGAHQGGSRARRSGDYDADPRELGDDFTSLQLRDEETPPPKPTRPPANPDLFKPTPRPPQSGPVDEVDALERRGTPNNGGKKWQPLTSIAPQPDTEENDPFSVGDSDDDKEAKTKDIRESDTQRLKEQASKSVSVCEGGDKELTLEKSETQGTKDKTAEELLKK